MGDGLKRAIDAARATRGLGPKYGKPMGPREAIALLTKAKSKYRAVKCEWRGEKFDSKKEMLRHIALLDMQAKGEIASLLRQPRYDLVVNGIHICIYVADWFYVETPQGGWTCGVVEDAKGFQTPEFKLKFKLAKALYPQYSWRLS